jgi:hypothetical protein
MYVYAVDKLAPCDVVMGEFYFGAVTCDLPLYESMSITT